MAFVAFGPTISASADWNYARELQDWYVEPEFDLYFRRAFQIKLSHAESFEAFGGNRFRYDANRLSAYSAISKLLTLNASVSIGKSPNYSPPAGVTPFLARSLNLYSGLSFRPARRLRVDQSYYYSRLGAGEDNVFTNRITRTKVNLQLTPSLSVRGIADYNVLVPTARIDADLSRPPAPMRRPRRTLGAGRGSGDLLFTYLLNPFTAVYLGFTDRYQNLELDTDTDRPPGVQITSFSPLWRTTQSPSTRTSRQLFMKLSYRLGP